MTELLIVFALILLNGLFALSELAVVSSRQPRLKTYAAAGRRGADTAIALASDPGRFLSAVQIGITLVGTINGAYSGETFGEDASEMLQRIFGLSPSVADPLGFGIVISIVTYLSVIIGELVPKTLALRNPEGIACFVAPSMALFARFAAPFVWALNSSTKFVFRVLGVASEAEERVTEEEIKTLIAEAESAGILESGEREMISGVMRLADRDVVGLMTPRTDVDWIDLNSTEPEIRNRLITTPHSRLPVGEGSPDKLIGVVQTRAILAAVLAGHAFEVRSHVRKAPIIPETTDALDVLEILRDAEVPMALVHDEYGDFEGLVTPADILQAIAGAFKSDEAEEGPNAIERSDGSWLFAGSMPADEMADKIAITLPQDRAYETVAGFVLAFLRHLPKEGEFVEVGNWRFEVVDLDGRRIDKILATRTVTGRRPR